MPWRAAPVLALLVLTAAGFGGWRGVEAQDWPGCDSFDTQPEAQAYWESHGRPAAADGDGDGKVC